MPRTHSPSIFAENLLRTQAELFAPFLAEVGLDEQVLHSPKSEIPLARYVELWETLGRKVDASIGLRLSRQADSSALGAFGHALRSAPTLPLVLRCLSHFIVVLSQATRVEVSEDARHFSVSYQITDPTIVLRRQDAEFSLGLGLSLLREVTENSALQPERVDFEHPAPADVTLHHEVFQCPVHFNQADNRLYFAKVLLDMPVRTADPRLFQALAPFLQQQRASRAAASDLLSRLGQHIASTLSSGGASLELVADSIGMGPRTLQRRLAEHQVEFSQLVEEVRRSLALAYVGQAEYSITEIAVLLGYAESSSFSRAFRRWTQLTPQQYRKQYRSAVDG